MFPKSEELKNNDASKIKDYIYKHLANLICIFKRVPIIISICAIIHILQRLLHSLPHLLLQMNG